LEFISSRVLVVEVPLRGAVVPKRQCPLHQLCRWPA
jgi:hypothetical protein